MRGQRGANIRNLLRRSGYWVLILCLNVPQPMIILAHCFLLAGDHFMTSSAPDVVIVGGGIAGGTMATVLARSGLDVSVLEREVAYPDRVRGEWVAPWGVVEFKRLGLLELLHSNGAIPVKRNVPYDENWAPDAAEQRAFDF